MGSRRAFTSVPATIVAAALGVMLLTGTAAAHSATSGTLYQRLLVSWRLDGWSGHDRASFQIPGIGEGDVICNPKTTWIQMVPSDRTAENDMWSVKWETKNGVQQTAVKNARVYEFSTPSSTVPHGTGASAYEGFNQHTPIESSDSGSMVGLISKRGALNAPGGTGVAPTSVQLSWSWSGFGSAGAQCQVAATFVTAIQGPSREVSEGEKSSLPASLGPVSSFNINWHGEAEEPAAAQRTHSLTVPRIGVLSGTCEDGIDGEAYLTLTPQDGGDPYAEVTTFQGEGIENSTLDDYYTDPLSGLVGPIALPVNGFLTATLLPAWNAPSSQQTDLLVSSIRTTNDPDTANDYCEVSVQAISAPDPVL